MADSVSRWGNKENRAILRHVCVDHCILLLQHLSTQMHFITNRCKCLSKTNSTDPRQRVPFKPLDPFGTEKKKNHRYTNNLQGLQKVVVKDFSWNIMPWNALLFEKTASILDNENYWFILNTCHDRTKHADTRVGFPIIFSQLRWPVEPKFSQVCYLI